MPTASDVLAHKGFSVHYVRSALTVLEAVERMNQLHVGAVVVMDQGHVQGMFSERDVLRRVVGERRDPAKTKVAEVMTREVIYCAPETDADQISAIMKDRRVRHLPVRDKDGDILGLISIGDINALHAMDQQVAISSLSDYIYGRT